MMMILRGWHIERRIRSELRLVPLSPQIRTLAKKSKGHENGDSPAADPQAVLRAMMAGKEKMKKSLDFYESKLESVSVSSGLDLPVLLKMRVVDSAGRQVLMEALGVATAPTPRKFLFTLTNPEDAQSVVKAVVEAGLNIQPTVVEQGSAVEIPVPKTSREQREAKVKSLSEEAEKIKVALRRERQEVLKKIKALKLPEDENRASEKKLQGMADAATSKVVELLENKKKQLLGGDKQ